MRSIARYILCFVIVIIVIFSFSACCCGQGDSSANGNESVVKQYIVGRYELYSIEYENGLTVTGETLVNIEDAMGDMYLELYSDGTALLSLNGQVLDMEFSDTKIWQMGYENEKHSFSVTNGKATLEKWDNLYTFVKQ